MIYRATIYVDQMKYDQDLEVTFKPVPDDKTPDVSHMPEASAKVYIHLIEQEALRNGLDVVPFLIDFEQKMAKDDNFVVCLRARPQIAEATTSEPSLEAESLKTFLAANTAARSGSLTAHGARKIVVESMTLDGLLYQIDASARMGIDTMVISGEVSEEIRKNLQNLGYDVQSRAEHIGQPLWAVMW